MSWITHPAIMRLRNWLRETGLAKPLQKLRASSSYEVAVDGALLNLMRPGDIVWDVGANVGYYSSKMAQKVGPHGRVFAFEPSPINVNQLRATCAAHPHLDVIPVGLSASTGEARFIQGSDELGATSRVTDTDNGAGVVVVQLRRGDDLVASGEAAAPNVIKVDVEGHELEVLSGLPATLCNPALRALVIEVHFALLERAGRGGAPKQIEQLLKRSGFVISWLDTSHLLAKRQHS